LSCAFLAIKAVSRDRVDNVMNLAVMMHSSLNVDQPNLDMERLQLFSPEKTNASTGFISAEIAECANPNEHDSRSIGSEDTQIIVLYQYIEFSEVLAGLA
jgi:hypothetical protein